MCNKYVRRVSNGMLRSWTTASAVPCYLKPARTRRLRASYETSGFEQGTDMMMTSSTYICIDIYRYIHIWYVYIYIYIHNINMYIYIYIYIHTCHTCYTCMYVAPHALTCHIGACFSRGYYYHYYYYYYYYDCYCYYYYYYYYYYYVVSSLHSPWPVWLALSGARGRLACAAMV